jgi:hypothetical protein
MMPNSRFDADAPSAGFSGLRAAGRLQRQTAFRRATLATHLDRVPVNSNLRPHAAIHFVAGGDCTEQQIEAWAPRDPDPTTCEKRIRGIHPSVVKLDGIAVAYKLPPLRSNLSIAGHLLRQLSCIRLVW